MTQAEHTDKDAELVAMLRDQWDGVLALAQMLEDRKVTVVLAPPSVRLPQEPPGRLVGQRLRCTKVL